MGWMEAAAEARAHQGRGQAPARGRVSAWVSKGREPGQAGLEHHTGEGWEAGERSVLTAQDARECWVAANNRMRTFLRKISLALVCKGLRCGP